jgi:hypothetical protein
MLAVAEMEKKKQRKRDWKSYEEKSVGERS